MIKQIMNYLDNLPQMEELDFEWTWNHQEPKGLYIKKENKIENINKWAANWMGRLQSIKISTTRVYSQNHIN